MAMGEARQVLAQEVKKAKSFVGKVEFSLVKQWRTDEWINEWANVQLPLS
jgi:hypothetical protein